MGLENPRRNFLSFERKVKMHNNMLGLSFLFHARTQHLRMGLQMQRDNRSMAYFASGVLSFRENEHPMPGQMVLSQ